MDWINKLEEAEKNFEKSEQKLSDPDIFSNPEEYKKTSKLHSDLSNIVSKYREYKKIYSQVDEAKHLIAEGDKELAELAQQDIESGEIKLEELESELKRMLVPKDPNDARDIILEIRAGTGGEEAALFAADLFRMYSRYAEINGWKIEIIDLSETGTGGFKEIIASLEGKGVYGKMKYESGTHRVQRVPITEGSGRIHTSASTVAVLLEPEEVDIAIRPDEIRIDTYRSSGHGGQHVNTTDSAIRVTHIPTGMMVTCQDEKSQHKNKAKALKVLRARLYDQKLSQQKAIISENRRKQVGSGDRSERIRTYNFPQNRISDHRVNLTLYKLDRVLEGDLEEFIEALRVWDEANKLKEVFV